MRLGSGIRKKPIQEPVPEEDAECAEEYERGEEARRTPRILFIQPPDIRIRHVHAAQLQEIICIVLNALKGTVG